MLVRIKTKIWRSRDQYEFAARSPAIYFSQPPSIYSERAETPMNFDDPTVRYEDNHHFGGFSRIDSNEPDSRS